MCVGRYAAKVMAQWKITGAMIKLLPNCEWNQKQKHKKQPWGNVECFAFGGATVRFASLETSFHSANHTIPPPPSYEGYPLCPKDKNCITLILVDFMHHNVGTCLWHVSNALIHCRLHRNMPKACPYAMALSFFWGWLVVEVEGGVFVAG